jgi:hypothetical protein
MPSASVASFLDPLTAGPVAASCPITQRAFLDLSLATVEPVSPPQKRKLEKSEQRPAPETRAQTTEMPEIAGQRPPPASLTRGNAGDFRPRGKYTPETEPSG